MVALDHQFYDVLKAVISSPPDGSAGTDRALSAVTGASQRKEYLAAMLEEGWLEGAAQRAPAGDVQAVYIRSVSPAGRAALIEHLAFWAGEDGLAVLSQVARRMTDEAPAIAARELDRLSRAGLLGPNRPPALTDLGELLLGAVARGSLSAGTTVVQGVTNSQVAIGFSRIEGDISVTAQPLEIPDLIAVTQALAARVAELGLPEETEQEVLADVATIRSQLDSPKPKRNIIHACATNIQAVLQGAVGSAVFAGFAEILRRLMS